MNADRLEEKLREAGCNFDVGRRHRRRLVKTFVETLDKIDRLETALSELVTAVVGHVNEHGGGGFILARLNDARAELARVGDQALQNTVDASGADRA